MAYDPSKIHKIHYDGKYLKMHAFHQTHPSPQRTPLLFQAGSSKAGVQFGGKHAEAIFCASPTIESTKKYVASVRARAAELGRDPSSIKFFLGIMPIIGRTLEEAEAKLAAARARTSVNGGLARFCGFTSKYSMFMVSRLPPSSRDAAVVLQNYHTHFSKIMKS
jgi:alkanesulfonate monooxygenase SsuD/methylene tetrahydromethanopterin reductase-like flavin-dependent oxidoreductase (luciferase family)